MYNNNTDRWERINELHYLIERAEGVITTLTNECKYYQNLWNERTPEEVEEHVGNSDYYHDMVLLHTRKIAYWTDLVPKLENLIYGVPSK